MLACHTTGGLGVRTWVRALFLSIVLLTLGSVPLASKSFAGTYTASECASWNTYSAAQYGEANHHMLAVTRDCGGGGNGLGIAFPQAYWAGGFGRWTVFAPGGTHMVTISGAARGVSADGWQAQVAGCSPTNCNVLGPFGGGYWSAFGLGAADYNNWWVQLVCVTGNCYGSPQAGAFVRDVTMVMSDDSAPNVTASGQLLNGQLQRGTGRIDVESSDVGAGLVSDWVLVNDQEVARQNYGCGGTPMQPCPSSGATLHFDIDTQSSPFHDGSNVLQVCAADYGGPPNVSCTAKRNIEVDNSCTPSSVPGGSDLSAVFPRSDSDTVDVKAGQGAALTGQLTDKSGNPVAGATLCVQEGIVGQGLESVGTLTTKSNGRYTYGVAPGPNRNLRVGYRFNRDQVQRTAHFNSRLAPKLKLSKRTVKNGRGVKLYGSIPGPSNNERVVILQARYPHSKRWNTFDKAKTDATGAYVLRYRFTSTFVTTNYRMRAVVPEQNGYPYDGGASRPKKIKVIGRTPHGHHL